MQCLSACQNPHFFPQPSLGPFYEKTIHGCSAGNCASGISGDSGLGHRLVVLTLMVAAVVLPLMLLGACGCKRYVRSRHFHIARMPQTLPARIAKRNKPCKGTQHQSGCRPFVAKSVSVHFLASSPSTCSSRNNVYV